jgi:hypothetical protein
MKNNNNNNNNKSVRFSETAKVHSFERLDRSEAQQKTLWYRQKDLQKIKQKIEDTVEEHHLKNSTSSVCSRELRGLEYQISVRQENSKRSKRRRISDFRRGLLQVQQQQQQQQQQQKDATEREIAKYSLNKSRTVKVVAQTIAAKDTEVALRIYEDTFGSQQLDSEQNHIGGELPKRNLSFSAISNPRWSKMPLHEHVTVAPGAA